MAIAVDDPESPVEIAAFLHLALAYPFGGRTPMQNLLYPSAGFGIAGSSPSRFTGTRVSL
jgi:hypothetical protein